MGQAIFIWRSVGIGRQEGLRSPCRKAYEFKSHLRYTGNRIYKILSKSSINLISSQYMKSSIIKPKTLVEERDRLTKQISQYWKIIATENIVKKRALKTGFARNYDLKAILAELPGLYDKLVTTKLRIQCINMGIKFADLPEDANVINIYKLSALNEYYVKLQETKNKYTINPKVKQKKGKKALTITEEITSQYLDQLINKCIIPLNALRKKIEDFNNNTEVDEAAALMLVA